MTGAGIIVGVGVGAGGVVARRDLFGRLDTAPRVTVVSAPAGSGKTTLVRSWIAGTGLGDRAAWVATGREERASRGFWLAVVDALRQTKPGSELVGELTAAPDLDGWMITERLLSDLAPLRERLWLVIDDVHELGPEVRPQLQMLVLRAPPDLRFVLITRHDVRLGLHRLRLEGELAEIRARDLRFSRAEARELFEAASVKLAEPDVAVLHERTEGWAAGLRLAALSLAGHPDPERFAAEFSGSERTVAEYLLAEVLDRQDERTRLLLLRTSILDRVNGELADLLTGQLGGERVLQDLAGANAFVMSLDAKAQPRSAGREDSARSWFRYHQIFAELLALELRRTQPQEVTGLHRAASGWFASHGFPGEAVRHAQSAGDWELAAGLLTDRWPGLYLDGKSATIHELLTGFPAGARGADAGLAAIGAADELAHGSLATARQYLAAAESALAPVPETRRAQARLLLGVSRLLLARERGNLPAAAADAQRLRALADAADMPYARGEELRALALISLGITEHWTARFADATRHLGEGRTLAHRAGRPYLEFLGLAYLAADEVFQSFARAAEHGGQAVRLAERHGWTDEPAVGIACMALGAVRAWQGRPDQAEPWVQRAERVLRAEAEPATGLAVRYVRGILELGRGRDAEALSAFQAAMRTTEPLAAPNLLVTTMRTFLSQALARLGEPDAADRALADVEDRDRGEMRVAQAVLRLSVGDPQAATAALAPVLDGSAQLVWPTWLTQAFLLEAIARDALGDERAAAGALERALDHAEPDGALLWFRLHPAPSLLKRHARHGTAHAALVADILSLLAGPEAHGEPARYGEPARDRGMASPGERGVGLRLPDPLSASELRVLRYLPTNLTGPEIAAELAVSPNTVKTHTRNLYAKLGTHRRAETVARARQLGLLARGAGGWR